MKFRWFRCLELALSLAALAVIGCSDDGETGDDVMGGAGVGGSNNAGSAGLAGNNTAGTGGAGSGDAVSFASDIWPILTANCSSISCHGDGSFLPQHASSDVNKAYMEAEPVADRIIGRVSGMLTPIMPLFCGPAPGFGMCLNLEQVALIRAWAEQGAPP